VCAPPPHALFSMDDLLGGHPVVDFSALPHAALERLAGHYGLSSRSPHLASQISAAFLAEAVDEEQVMLRLLRRCHPKKGGAARKQAPKSTARRQLGPQRTLETTPRKKSRSMTYGDMISAALRQLPARRGTLEQIYDEMEKKFGSQLNTELEAGPRQVGAGYGVDTPGGVSRRMSERRSFLVVGTRMEGERAEDHQPQWCALPSIICYRCGRTLHL